LAVDLGVSRGVVTDAYDQLVSEGYLDVKPRFPPVVAAVAAGPPPAAEPSAPRWRFDFSATTPDGQTPQAGIGLRHDRRRLRVVEPHGTG
jgi:GntR family transcriptional regulator/MocR family aminotransferase